jgi:hypothetical protein
MSIKIFNEKNAVLKVSELVSISQITLVMSIVEKDEQVITPMVTPSINIDPKIKNDLLTEFEEQAMVIVHCSYSAIIDIGIRIWSSTFLIDRITGSKSKLLHALNIIFAPEWIIVKGGTTMRFTLIFSALPKTCEVFDFIEEAPNLFGFEIFGIKRNSSDVYNVSINDCEF